MYLNTRTRSSRGRHLPAGRALAATGLAVTAALALAGCSGGSADVDPEAADGWSQEFAGTELNVLAEATLNSEILAELAPDFTAKTGIEVNIETAPFAQLVQSVTLDFSTAQGDFDVVSIPYDYLGAYAGSDYVEEITPLIEANADRVGDDYDPDDIIPGLWETAAEWGGKSYGMPSNSAVTMMMYRTDLLENPEEQAAFAAAYGYDLAPAQTWQQYHDIAEFFTRDAGETLAGEVLTEPMYGVTMAGKRHEAAVFEWMNYAGGFGGGVVDADGELVVDSDASVESLDYMKSLGEFAPPGFTSATWDEVTANLQQGIAAQAISWGDTAGAMDDESQSAVVGKIGYGDIPVAAEGDEHHALHGAWTYTISKQAVDKDAAYLFVAWALSASVQKQIGEMGGVPATRAAFEDADLVAALPSWPQQLSSLENAVARPRNAEWPQMLDQLALQVSTALVGDESPQNALTDAQTEIEGILGDKLPLKDF
ncbi:extracellular solute-binding protein [Microbacterium sp. K24]|jgi:multiple sugar transport system substrate-binding protein|uniref:extracellular solute-binding protein n=1 Tax=Microbacterium sp. K24 TaxID=2305446 RepID=UPI00109D049D|nr:extracellular solute-binding protein [Microbacterium sp. K24]